MMIYSMMKSSMIHSMSGIMRVGWSVVAMYGIVSHIVSGIVWVSMSVVAGSMGISVSLGVSGVGVSGMSVSVTGMNSVSGMSPVSGMSMSSLVSLSEKLVLQERLLKLVVGWFQVSRVVAEN